MNAPLLPDIAASAATHAIALDWVGMEAVSVPVQLDDQILLMRADPGVSLDDPLAKGIHMSRLYLALEALAERPLTVAGLRQLLEQFLRSHEGLSSQAFLTLKADLPLRRPALVSPLAGWKQYPLEIIGRIGADGFHVELKLGIAYSSTCPCSAALSRQLISQSFAAAFPQNQVDTAMAAEWLAEQGMLATPHSQRSMAHVHVRLGADAVELPCLEVIEAVEDALGTAVQTAVKRADEQAFALANGQNLMFCEDAARRIYRALELQCLIGAFSIRVVHAESLHAHDAVAQVSRGW